MFNSFFGYKMTPRSEFKAVLGFYVLNLMPNILWDIYYFAR